MTTRSKSNQFHSRIILLTVLAALVTAGPALSQTQFRRAVIPLWTSPRFSARSGIRFIRAAQEVGNNFYEARPVVGERVTENFSRYVSLEEASRWVLTVWPFGRRAPRNMPPSVRVTPVFPGGRFLHETARRARSARMF